MRILIKNATLISMEKSRDKIEKNIDILIENEIISKIEKNIKIESNIKIIDATNKIVMPGLINTHAHAPMSIFRETLDGYNLQDWLNKKIWPMEDKLTCEDIKYASELSFIEMIETGCTTMNDMYFTTEEIIKAANETGIRLQTTRTLTDIPTEEAGENRFKDLKALVEKYNNVNSKITFNVGIHGLYTAKEEYVKKAVAYAKLNKLNIQMHFCENAFEVEDIKMAYNNEPVNIIKELFSNTKLLLAHAVKLSNDDIENIKNMKNIDISIAHCPISNLKLGCGIANISKMQECGLNVCLGTDGQGSGSNLDMFETMKFAALLQKGKYENAKLMNSYQTLEMATINGAKALGLEDKIGSIEIGKQADIIILDINSVKSKPENDLISQIVYNVTGANVETTIVGGDILMENKILNIKINKENLLDRCEEIIKRISYNLFV